MDLEAIIREAFQSGVYWGQVDEGYGLAKDPDTGKFIPADDEDAVVARLLPDSASA